MTPRLVLFARYPTAGSAKTRLIPALGPQRAADVHRRLTERTIGVLRASELPVELHYTGEEEQVFRLWLGNDLVMVEQVTGDLTYRLMAALSPAPVIFFGADTPDLDVHHVLAAVSALEQNEVVLGPAHDGGYYLIGMKRPIPELLTDMPWSTDQVMPETLRRLDRLSIVPTILQTLHDCDRPSDLARWPWLTA